MVQSASPANDSLEHRLLLTAAVVGSVLIGAALVATTWFVGSDDIAPSAAVAGASHTETLPKLDQARNDAASAPATQAPEQLAFGDASERSDDVGLAIVDGRIAERADDDLQLLEFGESREETLAALLPSLGGPREIVTGSVCDSGLTDLYNWTGFTAAFRSGSGEFVGWSIGSLGVDLGITTLDGLGIDSSISDLLAIDPRAEFVREGVDWTYDDGQQTWLADSAAPDSPIYQIFNGEVCRLEADLAP